MIKTDGHGTIRKVKGGAVGVIALSTALACLSVTSMSGQTVNADTDKSTDTPISRAASIVDTHSSQSTSKEVPADTDKETYKKIESSKLDEAISAAKSVGVKIIEALKPIIEGSEADADKSIDAQINRINEIKDVQKSSGEKAAANSEKLKSAGLEVKDGDVEVFDDLDKMKAFIEEQDKSADSEVKSKQDVDKTVELATKELKDAGLEVKVGSKVLKSSASDALEASKELQNSASASIAAKKELNELFANLKSLADSAGVVVNDDKVVSFNDAKSAKDFLTSQIKDMNVLLESAKAENSKLDDAVKAAESKGITLSKLSSSKFGSSDELKSSISDQISKLQALIKAVDESKSLVESSTNQAKQSGLVLEGETIVSMNKSEDSTVLKDKVQAALKDLNDAANTQMTVKTEFDKLISDAKSKGLDVNVSGAKKISASDTSAELEAIKTKINKALDDKAKAQADYDKSVSEAKSANRLADQSSAKKEGDVYKNSVTIKSEGTSGSITVNTTGSAELVSVELIDPDGSKVESVKTLSDLSKFTNFNKSGNYTLNYAFRAKDDSDGRIAISANTTGADATKDKLKDTFNVTTKAPMSNNVENQIEPLTTVHVYDYSSSHVSKLLYALSLSRKIVEANTNPDSRHIIQLYANNYNVNSYVANIGNQLDSDSGLSTGSMTKQEALDVIDRMMNVIKEKRDSGGVKYGSYSSFIQGTADAMGNNRYVDESVQGSVPLEYVVEKVTKPSETISVVQYTDGWLDQGIPEEMDVSFAEWAKGRAKTFMSILNRNKVSETDTNSLQSTNKMTALGHPNIYDMTGKAEDVVEREVLRQFMETATVRAKAVKGENQLVTVSIAGDNAKVTKATLKGPTNKDLPIVDGKVNFSEKLPDGQWTVEYELSGDGAVNVVATVAGKEVVKETKTLRGTPAKSGYQSSVINDILAVVNPSLPKFDALTLENLEIVAKSVVLGQIETETTPATVDKEIKNATFIENVSPISFESTIKHAQASATVSDVYLKSEKPVEKPVEKKVVSKKSILPKTAGQRDKSLGMLGIASVLGSLLIVAIKTLKRR